MLAPMHKDHSQRAKSNPFVMAATPLLTLVIKLKNCHAAPDIKKLHFQINEEIKKFMINLHQLQFPHLLTQSAVYCLCAAVDEFVLSTSWGIQSCWAQSGMLSQFKNEAWGGERFYVIIEAVISDPRKNIYLLELLYILLSLGFEGKYFGESIGRRDEIRNRLFQKIRSSRGKIEKALSIHWRDDYAINDRVMKKNILKKILFISFWSVLSIMIYYNVRAYEIARPMLKSLALTAQASPIAAYGALLKRPLFLEQHQQELQHD